jgi:hypothetical protein
MLPRAIARQGAILLPRCRKHSNFVAQNPLALRPRWAYIRTVGRNTVFQPREGPSIMTDINAVNPRTARKLATGKGNIATRQWIDRKGNEVEEHEATGFKYTLLADPTRPYIYQLEDKFKPGEAGTMLAVFGGLTLAGNVVNSSKDDEDPLENVKSRFDLIDEGTWVNREGGFGPRYDFDLLAQCIAEVKGVPQDIGTFRSKMDSTIMIEGKSVKYPTAAMRNDTIRKLYESKKPKKEVKAPELAAL